MASSTSTSTETTSSAPATTSTVPAVAETPEVEPAEKTVVVVALYHGEIDGKHYVPGAELEVTARVGDSLVTAKRAVTKG